MPFGKEFADAPPKAHLCVVRMCDEVKFLFHETEIWGFTRDKGLISV